MDPKKPLPSPRNKSSTTKDSPKENPKSPIQSSPKTSSPKKPKTAAKTRPKVAKAKPAAPKPVQKPIFPAHTSDDVTFVDEQSSSDSEIGKEELGRSGFRKDQTCVEFVPLERNEFTELVDTDDVETDAHMSFSGYSGQIDLNSIQNYQSINDAAAETVYTDTLTKSYLPNGMKMYNQFIEKKTIGKGSFGKVILVEDARTRMRFAMKILSKDMLRKKRIGMSNEWNKLQTEIRILSTLNHPNITRLYNVIDSPETSKLFLVQELAEGGSIMTGEGPFSPLSQKIVQHYTRQLLPALHFMHQHNIIHRDIKPENILVTSNGQLKVGDFGCAIELSDFDEELESTVGTYPFFSPEVCSMEPYKGPPVDIWAAGVSVYLMSYGRLPFMNESELDLFSDIQNNPVRFPDEQDDIDEAHLPVEQRQKLTLLQHFLLLLLDKNPATRLTPAEAICHPWVTDGWTHIVPEELLERSLFTEKYLVVYRQMQEWIKRGEKLPPVQGQINLFTQWRSKIRN
ncbi:putative serine/threonine protein kinase [Blattamonas nauphoetae]|uniref:Serine/threonine protein kinase n=1 Tax=Blattamonas nauphoetae TaxID=2049346 RepID=A0ABQ9YM83_9EUKA|nr:putative serine/threonine protein kinase [Blattamonas nauphoetae]